MNTDEKRDNLLNWVKEYGISEDIREAIIDLGTEGAVSFVRAWFDGWGEAQWIVAYYTENPPV